MTSNEIMDKEVYPVHRQEDGIMVGCWSLGHYDQDRFLEMVQKEYPGVEIERPIIHRLWMEPNQEGYDFVADQTEESVPITMMVEVAFWNQVEGGLL